ncbi:MAG TPA: site-2 protease family protein [Terriglobales bacterium]|nr:site-2 protease family protein [Terriglobales bacterium]
MENDRTQKRADKGPWYDLLLILVVLIPLAVLFLLPGGGFYTGTLWFWLFLLVCFWLLFTMLGMPGATVADTAPQQPRMLHEQEQPSVVRELMDVQVATEQPAGVQVFRGTLRESAAAVYDKLKRAFSGQTVPMVQEDEELGASILLLPKPVEQATMERPVRMWLHWLLFALTVLTTTWAGAAHQGVNLLREPARFAIGLPYSIGLMAILGIHELGHYFTARRNGIRVTPPFFVPVPFALGTFGAFIQMRSPTENRRALFDVAVAGPLAGLVVAIPALFIGLKSSTVLPGDAATALGHMGGTSVGSSLLFALLSKLSLGDALQYGHVLRLSPLAFAGWLGLFVTALNLLPVGQLDGGHIAHAVFGRRVGDTIGTVAMWSLLLLAIFVWPGLTLWAVIVFFLAGRTVPPLNDLTPLTPGRRWLGYAAFVILALILAPLPHSLWQAAGIHCPYM